MSEHSWHQRAEVLPPAVRPGRRRIWRPGLLSWRRWGATLLLALAVTLITCRMSPHFSSVEFALLYRWMALRPVQQPHPDIALVGIGKRDVDEFNRLRPTDCTCGGVCRADLGRVVARLKRAGASVVALDLVLAHPCPVPGHDGPLIEALAMPGECVLAVSAITNPDAVIFEDPASTFVDAPADPAARFLGPPVSQRIRASPVLYNPGGVVRGVSLMHLGVPSDLERAEKAPLEGVYVTLPPLSLAAFTAAVGRPCDMPEVVGHRRMRCAGLDVPVWDGACIYLLEPLMAPCPASKQVMLINWAGPPGTFPTYRLRDVLTADDLALQSWFRNRVAIVGSMVERVNTPALGPARADARYADQAGATTMCGIEVHANALNTMLQRRFIKPAGPALMWALVLAMSLLAVVAVRGMATWPATITVAASLLVLFVTSALLVWVNYWVYAVTPVVAVTMAVTVTGLWSYARSRQEAMVLTREAVAREEATATIVHDLKQPLAAISGLASIIQMSQEKLEQAGQSPELIERIKHQVERALSDIDEILVANPDRRLHLRPECFDMVELARDLAVAQAAKSTVHEVEVRGPEEGVWVEGDAGYLARAASNLMDNAIKYWPEGGTVIVEVRAAGGEALISVTDQGIGMPRDQQALVFERYHRAVPEEVNIPGTGIGLYSVRRIAEAHGGSVEVWSEPGKGSTFTLRLPLAQVGNQAPPGG